MFIDLIEKMRKRTHKERQFFAISIAGILTALIAIIWISTLATRLSGLPIQPGEAGDISVAETSQQGAVIKSLQSQSRQVKELFEGSVRYFKNFSRPTEYERESEESPFLRGENVLQ